MTARDIDDAILARAKGWVDENEKNKKIDAFQVRRSLNQICFSDRTIEVFEAGIQLNDKSKIESHIGEIAMSQRDSEKPVSDSLREKLAS